MNSHDFRTVVKELDSKTIKDNNMNPAHFKAVCLILSMYGDYETGTSIRPSWLTVAKEACVDRKTAMKVRDYLLSVGLLIQLSKTEGNISVYKYGELSILDNQLSNSNEQLSNSEDQLSSIDGHNTTIYTTTNTTFNSTKETKKKGRKEWNHLSLTYPLEV